MVLLTTGAQLCVKLGAARIPAARNWVVFIRAGFNTYIICGGILILMATVAYIFALTRIPLNIAYSFTGFNYILVFMAGWRILKEEVNVLQFIGVALIFLGIVTWNI